MRRPPFQFLDEPVGLPLTDIDRASLVPSCRRCNMEKLDFVGWKR